jgi:hypothetical protein
MSIELNIRKPSYIFSHIALFLTCLIIGITLALTPQFLLMDQFPLGLTSPDVIVRNVLTTLFALMLLYTLLRGVFSQGVRNCMASADIDLLALAPVDPRSLVMAKCARNLVSRLSITLIVFFVIYPVSLVLRTPLALFLATLLSITLYVEFLQVASTAVQSVSDAVRFKISNRTKFLIKILTVVLSAVVIAAVLLSTYFHIQLFEVVIGNVAEDLWVYLPSSTAASSIVNLLLLNNAETVVVDLGVLATLFCVSLAAIYVSSKSFHPEHLLPYTYPIRMQHPAGFRVGSFLENRFSWQKPSLIVFLKDVQLTLRGALIDFSLLNFVIMYGVSLAAWFLLESVLPVQTIPDFEEHLGPLKTFVKEFVLILALVPFIPSLTSFSRELGKIWILKSLPFKSRALTNGKFLFALTISAVSLAPMVLAAGWIFGISFSEWMLGVLLPFILLLANSFGVLVGAYLPPYDLNNQMSLKSTSTFFISLVIILSPFALIISARSVPLQAAYLIMLAAYSILVTNIFLEGASKGFEKLELKRVLPHNPRLEQSAAVNQKPA